MLDPYKCKRDSEGLTEQWEARLLIENLRWKSETSGKHLALGPSIVYGCQIPNLLHGLPLQED